MKKIIVFVFAFFLTFISLNAQVYTGGNVGVSYDDGMMVELAPLVGYKIEKLSFGVSPFVYYYDKSKMYNWGGRLFSEFNVTDNIFAHAEIEASQEISTKGVKNPMVLAIPLGVGYQYEIAKNTFAQVSILYNVLDDGTSGKPNPTIRGGINYNF